MAGGEPDLPKDPAAHRPRPLLGAGFWAFIAFGILCVLAGVAVVLLAAGRRQPDPPQQPRGGVVQSRHLDRGRFPNRPVEGTSPLPGSGRLSSAGRAAHS